ncbi:peptidoglycan-binding protein [Benzoatithermus flavus]|uniref:Peptidoglycan-binding protein n=1 Tax=Benzoatithermus flavus TaxID=3108223 RepID=A0ABU8XPY6_9PROT
MIPVLRRGAHGDEVELLQKNLSAAGFSPGRIDGRFGPATEAALLAFQRSRGLLPDGVAGPVTWHALNGRGDGRLPDVTASVTIGFVAELFPFAPLGVIRRHLPAVLTGLRAFALTDRSMVLMALATIRAESEGFAPVEEAVSRFNTSPEGHPFDLYDYRADLGNEGPPDGRRYRGRGFVQLTGRANYRTYGEALGLGTGLVLEPERALEPALAGRLLGAFLAERRRPIGEALAEGDLARARRLVNGGTHGLDRFTDAWRIGDRLLDDPAAPAPAGTARGRAARRQRGAAASMAAARAVTAAMSG